MTGARWIGVVAAAGVMAAGLGALGGWAAREQNEPDLKEEAPVAKVGNVALETVPLMPPLIVGGQEIHTVRVKGTPGGDGTVELDPNPVVVDRYGNPVKMGLRAFKPAEVRIVLLSDSMPAGDVKPGEGNTGAGGAGVGGWRLYDLRPVPPTPAWPDRLALRLVMRDGACGPSRLLVLDGTGAAVRIVTMESAR